MKHEPQPQQQSLYDDYFVHNMIPDDHPLLQIDREVDFSFVRELVAHLYSPSVGREALDPEMLLRLCFLQSYYGLSDREVISRAQTDLAFRVFLHLGVEDALPHPTMLTVFRKRLGKRRFEEIFNRSVTMAVERGLVEGKLVLVDSYGIHADVAVPRRRKLLQRIVRQALAEAEGLGIDVSGLRAQQEALLKDDSWMLSKELRENDLQNWFELSERLGDTVAAAEVTSQQDELRQPTLHLLSKACERQERPKSNERGDRMVSDVDPDARWSMRGRGKKAFVGYKEQIATDAKHEIITAAEVTPGNVDDTTQLQQLLADHESNTGQRPEAAAGDSGYSSGQNRAELKEREITDYVAPPTPKGHKQGKFSASDFEPDFDDDGTPIRIRCPAGEVASNGKWQAEREGWNFYFKKAQCEGCQFRKRCSKSKRGRGVFISRYWQEHREAWTRRQEPEFIAAQIARLGIERTFAYKQRRSGHKRASYRGLERVGIQVFLSCFMVNVVRISRAAKIKMQC